MTGKFLIATGLVLAASLIPGTLPATAEAATLSVPANHATIAEAFAAAATGDRVEVAPGTYYESGLRLPNGVALVGASGDPRDVVIDARSEGRILLVDGASQATLVSNITFRNGYAAGRTGFERSGGAIFCSGSTVQIYNCTFEGNQSQGSGGAIRCTMSTPLITGCVFRDNRAEEGGGAIDCSIYSSPLIRGCTFTANAASWGGALSCRGASSPTVYSSIFDGNGTFGDKSYGGAIFADVASQPAIDQSTFYGNTARYGGALACFEDATTDLEHCTLTENTAEVLGGGLFAYESSPNITATIVAFQNGSGISAEGAGQPQITCSNIYGNSQGDWVGAIATQLATADNITADPLFCGSGDGAAAFTLATSSPSSGDGPCGTMGAWPVGCSLSAISVTAFGATWDGQAVTLEWHALLYDQAVEFRVTGAWADEPASSWDVPFTVLGGGFYEAVDRTAAGSGDVVYRLYMDAGTGSWEYLDEARLTPVPAFTGIRELKAYPNPFNPMTTISFRLGTAQRARISVYTPSGRRVAVLADQEFGAGPQSVNWEGLDASGARVGSGLYIVLVEGATERLTRKITLVK
ncbi:right-handed parallel beta-helix repeat-containing protein [bacterium]|nr:right-handed parallel beta-helix repeat-containing protein [bacterium]